MPVKLGELVRAIPAEYFTQPPAPPEGQIIRGLSCDSRYIQVEFLFAALPGIRTDGTEYIKKAAMAGAEAILVEGEANVGDFSGTVLRAVSARKVLGLLAALFYAKPSSSLRVVGITGTDGKTSTVWILHQLLLAAGRRAAMAGTLGIRTDGTETEDWPIPQPAETADKPRHWTPTTPEAPVFQEALFDLLKRGFQDVVVEVSSHGLAQSRMYGTQFAVVALTHVSSDHLDFHGTDQAYREAKAMLYDSATRGGPLEDTPVKEVLNLDDDLGCQLYKQKKHEFSSIVTFSRTKAGDVKLLGSQQMSDGICLELDLAGEELSVKAPFLGKFNEENLLTAITCAYTLGLTADDIGRGLLTLAPVPGRFETIFAGQPFMVVVDYAHTEDGLNHLLEAARDLGRKRVILVFGCGGDRDRLKRQPMGKIAGQLADLVIVTTDNPRSENAADIVAEIERGLGETDTEWVAITDRAEALRRAVKAAQPDDIVVVAGKGAESVQDFGTFSTPFDDREQLREILAEIGETGTDDILAGPSPDSPGADSIAAQFEEKQLDHNEISFQGSDPRQLRVIAEMIGTSPAGVSEADWPVISTIPASGVVIDSRNLSGGEVFIALAGNRVDGHDYLDQAFKAGATAAVIARQWWNQQLESTRQRIRGVVFPVDDPLQTMQSWASKLRCRVNPVVAAVTGSSGKTTTKELILGLLGESPEVIGTIGNRNNEIGLPWTMLGITEETRSLVLEMGTNHSGEIAALSRIASPDVALITCIGSAHEGELGGPAGVLAAKLEITEGLSPNGTLIIPDNDPRLEEAARKRWPGRIQRFGFSGQADVRGGDIEYGLCGTRLSIDGFSEPVNLRLLGPGAAQAALAAIAVVRAMGQRRVDPEDLEQVLPTPGRLYPVVASGVTWLLDMYNASPESTRCNLKFLASTEEPGRKVFVFGGMQELGQWSAREHEAIGRLCGFCDLVLLVGKAALQAEAQAEKAGAKAVSCCNDPADVVSFLGDYLKAGDVVLLKGARSAALEKVAEALGVIDASFGKGGL